MQRVKTQDDYAAFWDKIAPKYAKKAVGNPAAYEAKIAHLRTLLKDKDNVLEIGCGTGSTALQLASCVTKLTATDISYKMIEIAEEKRRTSSVSNVSFHKANALDILPGAPYDAIMAFSLLHLVNDMPAVLRAIYDQLKPGGLFLSKTVCLGNANPGLRVLIRIMSAMGIAPPIAYLKPADVEDACRQAGFEILDCRYFAKGTINPFLATRRPLSENA